MKKKFGFLVFSVFCLVACSPTVKIEVPDKPMEINLNVKIDHNIKVQVDKKIDKMMKENDDIF